MADEVEGQGRAGEWLPPVPGESTGPPTAPPPGPEAPPPGANRPPQPRPPYAPPAETAAGAEGIAWAGLALSAAGATILYVTNGLGAFVSLPLAIAGWVVSQMARQRIRDAGVTRPSSVADAGMWAGVACTVISAIALVVVVIVLLT